MDTGDSEMEFKWRESARARHGAPSAAAQWGSRENVRIEEGAGERAQGAPLNPKH